MLLEQRSEIDLAEPRRVAESVAQMGLRYSTVTGVEMEPASVRPSLKLSMKSSVRT